MTDDEKIVVRDLRRGAFMVDDAFVDSQMRKAGTATLVYMALCRHANKSQDAWPSFATIQEETGIKSRTTVGMLLKRLEALCMIHVGRGASSGKREVNRYTLLDQSLWTTPSLILGTTGKNKRLPCPKNDVYHVQIPCPNIGHKGVHVKEHIEGIRVHAKQNIKNVHNSSRTTPGPESMRANLQRRYGI